MENKKIVFFDGVCNFCNSTVDFIWNNNKKRNLYYASLQSDFSKDKLLNSGIKDFDLKTIYYIDGKKVFEKSHAVFIILKSLDGVYPILGKIGLLLPRYISDFFYDIIAKNRYKIMGKQETCRIPNKEEEEYFLG